MLVGRIFVHYDRGILRYPLEVYVLFPKTFQNWSSFYARLKEFIDLTDGIYKIRKVLLS